MIITRRRRKVANEVKIRKEKGELIKEEQWTRNSKWRNSIQKAREGMEKREREVANRKKGRTGKTRTRRNGKGRVN